MIDDSQLNDTKDDELEEKFDELFNKADELAKILFSILKKTRIKEK